MKDTYQRNITYLRLSVTELCNLRCRYCMPEEGICKKQHAAMLTEEEMIDAVRAAAALGVTKLRITGGEPLVKKNIVSICRKAAAVEGIREVDITTNGVLLPKLAAPLREAGVKRLNISLDTLQKDKFRYITRIGSIEDVFQGIEAAFTAGFDKIKLNTVLIGGFNETEIEDFAALTRKYPLDVRFIELMPMYDSGDFGPEAFIPGERVLQQLRPLEPQKADGGVARLYRLPGAKGNIGLISPVSNHFCAQCNRMRLTADGQLIPCLHAGAEYSIKGMNQAEMEDAMRKAILKKPQQHKPLSFSERSDSARNMNQIGG